MIRSMAVTFHAAEISKTHEHQIMHEDYTDQRKNTETIREKCHPTTLKPLA